MEGQKERLRIIDALLRAQNGGRGLSGLLPLPELPPALDPLVPPTSIDNLSNASALTPTPDPADDEYVCPNLEGCI